MSVRAKFKVMSIERSSGYTEGTEVQTIKMIPVYSNKPNTENEKFYAATPSGRIELGVVNSATGSYFELNKEYYVDFVKAEVEAVK